MKLLKKWKVRKESINSKNLNIGLASEIIKKNPIRQKLISNLRTNDCELRETFDLHLTRSIRKV